MVATFFDIVMYLKRYVGGLVVSYDARMFAYLALRWDLFLSIIELTASLFVGFGFFWKPRHKQFSPFLAGLGSDVQRFER